MTFTCTSGNLEQPVVGLKRQRAGPGATCVSRPAPPTVSPLPVDTLTSRSFSATSRSSQSALGPGAEVASTPFNGAVAGMRPSGP